ncbi:ParB N-terminal domain-containing protein [Nocardia asiatica]|uniref:transcriptional regulator n=1 Tax=Nocardia asiatica TaxID=209252 RepID=UPI002453B664|nr:transcriptional regulator [Nocardia asiatica]
MFTDFGVPPDTASTRLLVEERLKEQRENIGVAETLTVEWRGRPLHVQVIDMPLDALYYNPGTHRIRAQRSLDPRRDAELAADPWCPEGQDYLRYLLTIRPSEPDRRDPAFDELKKSLEEHKQNEPGLITRDGILVNGNTRCAALRELNTTMSMRVGVLPESCTWEDINDVELSLQLRPDNRRDYSYINRLLAIDEQRVQLKRDLSVIAKVFHTTTKACERDLWVLAQLRDLIHRSTTADGMSLRLVDLERSQEKLAELYRAYDREQKKSKERADLLKEARLAAIVLDFSKTDVRFIEADFQSRYLDKTLPEQFKATEVTAPSAVEIPGLNRIVKTSGAKVTAARAVTDALLRAKAVEAAGEAATPAEQSAAAAVIASYQDAFNEAIDTAGRDIRLRKKRLAGPDRIIDACKDLEQCITDLVMSRGNGSLDEGAFDDALDQLRTVLGKLSIEGQRSIDLPGNGLAWLIAAVALERPQS